MQIRKLNNALKKFKNSLPSLQRLKKEICVGVDASKFGFRRIKRVIRAMSSSDHGYTRHTET